MLQWGLNLGSLLVQRNRRDKGKSLATIRGPKALFFLSTILGGNLDPSCCIYFPYIPKSENTAVSKWCGVLKGSKEIVQSAFLRENKGVTPSCDLTEVSQLRFPHSPGLWECPPWNMERSEGQWAPLARNVASWGQALSVTWVSSSPQLCISSSNLLPGNEQRCCHCFPLGNGDVETLLALPKILIVARGALEAAAAEQGIDHKASDSTLMIRIAGFICK